MVVTNLLVTVLYAVNKENIMNLMQESNKIQAYTEVLDVVEKYPSHFLDLFLLTEKYSRGFIFLEKSYGSE